MAFKALEDLSPDELDQYARTREIPEHDPERDAAMRDAGWDPVTHKPLDLEAERAKQKKQKAREKGYRVEEEKSMEDRIAELEKANRVPGGFLAP